VTPALHEIFAAYAIDPASVLDARTRKFYGIFKGLLLLIYKRTFGQDVPEWRAVLAPLYEILLSVCTATHNNELIRAVCLNSCFVASNHEWTARFIH
jgi:hypothetical protein